MSDFPSWLGSGSGKRHFCIAISHNSQLKQSLCLILNHKYSWKIPPQKRWGLQGSSQCTNRVLSPLVLHEGVICTVEVKFWRGVLTTKTTFGGHVKSMCHAISTSVQNIFPIWTVACVYSYTVYLWIFSFLEEVHSQLLNMLCKYDICPLEQVNAYMDTPEWSHVFSTQWLREGGGLGKFYLFFVHSTMAGPLQMLTFAKLWPRILAYGFVTWYYSFKIHLKYVYPTFLLRRTQSSVQHENKQY